MGCCTKLCTSTVRQHLAAGGVGHGAMAIGILLAWSSLAIPQLSGDEALETISGEAEAWIANITLLGALLAVLPTGILLDKYGRRPAMLASAIPVLVGWIIIISAKSVGILCLGRFVAGLSAGAISVILPIYITEIAEARIRGLISYSFMQHFVAGALFVTIVGHVLGWSWKILVYKSIPISILFFVAAYFLPESPLYLFSAGQNQAGNDALKWFRVTSTPESLEKEIKDIQSANVEAINLDHPELTESSNSLTKQLGIPCMLMLLQQLTCGVHVIMGTASITGVIEQSFSDPSSIYVTITLTALISVIVGSHLVDRLGRRPLLITSCVLMSFALFVLGLSNFVQTDFEQISNREKWIRLISFVTYISGFSFGLGSISWLMMAELVPGVKKGFWVAIVTTFYWLPAFVIGMYLPLILSILTLSGFLWICSLVALFAALFSYLFVPETAKQSIWVIQTLFEETLKIEYPV